MLLRSIRQGCPLSLLRYVGAISSQVKGEYVVTCNYPLRCQHFGQVFRLCRQSQRFREKNAVIDEGGKEISRYEETRSTATSRWAWGWLLGNRYIFLYTSLERNGLSRYSVFGLASTTIWRRIVWRSVKRPTQFVCCHGWGLSLSGRSEVCSSHIYPILLYRFSLFQFLCAELILFVPVLFHFL